MLIRYALMLSLLSGYVAAEEEIDSSLGSCIILPPTLPSVDQHLQGLSLDFVDDEPASDRDGQIIQISSDSSRADLGSQAQFLGNVIISQGSRLIRANSANFNQQTEELEAIGDLYLKDSALVVTADALTANMQSNQAQLSGANYWFTGQQIHGDASILEITPDNNLVLADTSFTTCPDPSSGWLLQADKIKIDSSDEWGEIWDAKLRIGGTSILYVPYMTIPVSDKRKTGFLFPSFSTSSTNGIELTVPWYWNIAPEYDFTFTPVYMSSRGLFLKNEFRYLAGDAQNGQFNVEYLASDDEVSGSPNRHLIHWQHQGAIDRHWRVMADFADVSDNNYFNDLPSGSGHSTDNQLVRSGEVSYFQDHWNASIFVQDIHVLGDDSEPYQVMPQLSYHYYQPDLLRGYDFNFYSELTNFKRVRSEESFLNPDELSTATRLHLEPSIAFPFYGPAGSLIAEAKLYQTQYWQRNFSETSGLDKTVSRTIPQVRLYGQMNFERPTEFMGNDYRQVFEPQVQYLYVGYQNQNDIGLYDTAVLQDDFHGLFRDRRFAGLDRISNTSQMTIGATNRIFNSQNEELLTFSLGQIFFFEDNKVGLSPQVLEETPSFSVIAAELDAHLFDKYYLSGGLQFDTEENDYRKSEISVDYRQSSDELIQLSYRHVPDLINTTTNDTVDISQVGLRTAWPIGDDLYFVGNWYYDLKEKRSVETFTGFQYEACCWAVRLSYHHHIRTNYDDEIDGRLENRDQFESGVSLNFVIKGLGGTGPLGVKDMLDEGIFNYRQPLYLRN